jgi:hypothetical protein
MVSGDGVPADESGEAKLKLARRIGVMSLRF